MFKSEMIKETVDYLNRKTSDFEPEIAIILGSGLGDFANVDNAICVPYNEIPNFEVSTVKGHKGQLVFANLYGKKIVFMQGRFHFYEGHPIQKVVFPIAVFKKLGVKTLIVTNAAGGVNNAFSGGDLMLIVDHINLMGTNPLIGRNNDEFGVRFPDMSEVYSKRLIALAKECANDLKIDVKEGVYAAMTGPSYETPAEIKMLQKLGADAVGMSTVPEAIFANYCGIKTLGISCITNLAAGLSSQKLNHNEVIETADISKDKFKKLLSKILEKI